MNIKVQKFIVGGLGCVAPNIVNYASTAVSGSAIPGNLVSTMLGAVILSAATAQAAYPEKNIQSFQPCQSSVPGPKF